FCLYLCMLFYLPTRRSSDLQIEEDKLLPKQGVYGVYVYIAGKKYYGLLNLGVKPTFHDHLPKPSPEVYILDFEEDIYGEQITVRSEEHTSELQSRFDLICRL